jgi:hypothetical protein
LDRGDFDFDPARRVDFSDLVILAQRYNTSLPAPGAFAAPVASASTFAADWAKATAVATAPTAKKPEPKKAKPTPVFSVAPVAKAAPAKRKVALRRT